MVVVVCGTDGSEERVRKLGEKNVEKNTPKGTWLTVHVARKEESESTRRKNETKKQGKRQVDESAQEHHSQKRTLLCTSTYKFQY